MSDTSLKNPYVLFKYIGVIRNHFWKEMMLFKPISVDKACVQAQYLDNIGENKGKLTGRMKKDHHEYSKEGNKKWK